MKITHILCWKKWNFSCIIIVAELSFHEWINWIWPHNISGNHEMGWCKHALVMYVMHIKEFHHPYQSSWVWEDNSHSKLPHFIEKIAKTCYWCKTPREKMLRKVSPCFTQSWIPTITEGKVLIACLWGGEVTELHAHISGTGFCTLLHVRVHKSMVIRSAFWQEKQHLEGIQWALWVRVHKEPSEDST